MKIATGIIAIAGSFLFFGGAVSLGFPMVGGIVFVAAALVALTGVGQFPDLQAWAELAPVLTAMAMFAWRADRQRRNHTSAAKIRVHPRSKEGQ